MCIYIYIYIYNVSISQSFARSLSPPLSLSVSLSLSLALSLYLSLYISPSLSFPHLSLLISHSLSLSLSLHLMCMYTYASLYHVCMQKRPIALPCVHAATMRHRTSVPSLCHMCACSDSIAFYLHIQRTYMMAQTSIFKAALRNCSMGPP